MTAVDPASFCYLPLNTFPIDQVVGGEEHKKRKKENKKLYILEFEL